MVPCTRREEELLDVLFGDALVPGGALGAPIGGTLYLGGYVYDPLGDTDIEAAVWRTQDGATFERVEMPVDGIGNSPTLVATDHGLLGIVSMGPYESDDPWTVSFIGLDDAGGFSIIDANPPDTLVSGVNLWDATYFDGNLVIVGERIDEPGMPWSWVWTPAA